VQISPDDQWLYVTSTDGSLSKLDPAAGSFHDVYTPEPRTSDGGDGGVIEWAMLGLGGISFYMGDDNDDDSYLVYWVFDIPRSQSVGPRPASRVIAVRHDSSKEIEVLWTKVVPGIIEGTPVIGSDGKFIYFTMNSKPTTNAPTASPVITPAPTDSPTIAPVTDSPVVTDTPTKSPVVDAAPSDPVLTTAPTISPNNTTNNTDVTINTPTASPILNSSVFNRSGSEPDDNNNNDLEETTTKPEYWWAEETEDGVFVCVKNSNYPDTYATNALFSSIMLYDSMGECCEERAEAICNEPPAGDNRHLQLLQQISEENSGFFLVLSHSLDGEIIYQFDSRSEKSIQQHYFAALEIAHAPEKGNYNGGEGNTNDVVIWGSAPDANELRQGDTVLFQLPMGFDASQEPLDTAGFEVQVLESVPWTTRTKPVLSSSGMDVYFAVIGNKIAGWNRDQKFDVVANVGPVALPGLVDSGYSSKPIVIADDGKMLLVTSPTDDILSAVYSETEEILWVRGISGDFPFTTPRVSPDGAIAYFGKQNSIHAVDLYDEGFQVYGEDGYSSNSASDVVMTAEISLSSTGEFLFYNGGGRTISAIRIANAVPTQSPVVSPTSTPSLIDSTSPSLSAIPSTSSSPSGSASPSVDPDYIPPSSSPTMTGRPSALPSSSNAPSLRPTDTPTVSPNGEPTFNPISPWVNLPPTSDSANPPSSASELPDDSNKDENSFALSQTAIIAIAVGGGVGLLLLIGGVFYILKKRGSGHMLM